MLIRKLLHMVLLAIMVLFTMGYSFQIKATSEDDTQIIIPLDFSTLRPVLELYIGSNGPYRFIFDTGSSGNVIDTELAKELKLDVVGEDILYTPGSDIKRTSTRVEVPLINFPNTSISEDVVMNTVDIRKMVSVDGIISTSFFAEYLVTISYPQSKLILSAGELDSTNKDVIPYQPKQKIINLKISIGGYQTEAHLDSGNPGRFGIPYALKDKLNFINEPKEAGAIETPTASFKKWKAKLNGVIKVGNIVYENPEINLVENSEFVNLGYQFSKNLDITIDKKNNLIKFEKAAMEIDENANEKSKSEQN